MAYYQFSTEQVDYVFEGVTHHWGRNNLQAFQGIDALLVEEAGPKTKNRLSITQDAVTIYPARRGGQGLIQYIVGRNLSIFSVDVGVSNDKTTHYECRDQARSNADFPLSAIIYALSRKSLPEAFRQRYFAFSHPRQEPVTAGRSAITAEKAERFADRLKRKINKRPFIGIVYGLGHCDIIDYLLQPTLRKEALDYHKRRSWRGLDPETLDRLVELQYFLPTNSWTRKQSNLGVFRIKTV